MNGQERRGAHRGNRRRGALFAGVLGLLMGCGEGAPAPAVETSAAELDARPVEGSAVDEAPAAPNRDALLERIAEDPGALFAEFTARRVAPSALRYLLLDEEAPLRIRRREFLAAMYNEREFAPLFFGPGVGPARVDAVLASLATAPDHALDVDRYLTDVVLQAVRDAREWRAVARHEVQHAWTDEQRARLHAIASELPPGQHDALVDALFAAALDGDEPVFEPLRAHFDAVLDVATTAAGAAAVAEIALVDVALLYAFDQRHFNVSMMKDATEEEQHAAIAERMRATFEALASAPSAEAVREVFDALPPSHPQYPLLFQERARYAEIVARGGWDEVRPTTLRRGSRGARVAELKRRLQAEGFFDGVVDETFDEALEAAVRAYQETHQMSVTGESSREFWSSLNIPAQNRLAQIELTMQRWRESQIGDDPYYIFVNIPDFHAEVWKDGERQLRFRIVVGNTQRVCDTRSGQWRMPNATPVQSELMSYVVLNPYWNIPSRILEEELLPSLVDREDYFESQGIEVVETNGSRRVRQRPGPRNPLGRVKFMFPNPHDTYLHDTSRPQYFQYPIRAFSHGCMRVQDPLDFLELLLRNDGQWDEQRIERIFESEVETSVRFQTAVPVHVEYYVVTVDDQGRANFAADIYRHDRDRLNPPSPEQLRCTPDPTPEHRLVLGADGRPMLRDSEGNLIDPSATVEPEAADPSDPTLGDFGP